MAVLSNIRTIKTLLLCVIISKISMWVLNGCSLQLVMASHHVMVLGYLLNVMLQNIVYKDSTWPNFETLYFPTAVLNSLRITRNINLCHHQQDSNIDAECTFFGTSHGKSPCNGIEEFVKHYVTKYSLQRQNFELPINAWSMCKRIPFHHILRCKSGRSGQCSCWPGGLLCKVKDPAWNKE